LKRWRKDLFLMGEQLDVDLDHEATTSIKKRVDGLGSMENLPRKEK